MARNRVNLSYHNNHLIDSPDHVYYDITVNHLQTNFGNTPIEYFFTNQQDIILNSGEYNIAVSRFFIPANIPVLIVIPSGNPSNINELIYTVTMSYTDPGTLITYDYQQNLIWLPYTYDLPPTTPLQEDYYFEYYIEHMLSIFNTAISNALTNLNTVVNTATGFNIPGWPILSPYLIWNSESHLLSLITLATYSPTNIAYNNLSIYFNSPAFTLLDPLPADFINDNPPLGKAYKIFIYSNDNYYNPSNVVPSSPPLYLQIIQEFPNIINWYPIKNIFFESNLIPITKQFITSQSNLTNQQNQGNQTNQRGILTDFVPIFQNDITPRSSMQYFADNYKFITLLDSDKGLRPIDIKVFWTDIFGVVRPLTTWWNQYANIKLVFVKKGLAN